MKFIALLFCSGLAFGQISQYPQSTGGGGSGTVGAGTAGQYAIYPSTGTTVGGSTALTDDSTNLNVVGRNLAIGTTVPGGAPAGSVAALGNIYSGGVNLSSPTGIAGLFTGTCSVSPCPLGSDGTKLNLSTIATAVFNQPVAIGPYTFTCSTADGTSTICINAPNSGDSNNFNVWFGADGSNTYNSGHVPAQSAQYFFTAGVNQGSNPFVMFLNKSGSQVGQIYADGHTTWNGTNTANGFIAKSAAATAAAGQIAYGSTTVASSFCGSLSGSLGCIVVNIAGTTQYVPYW